MHDDELVERLAVGMQRQHDKEVLGEIRKWEKRPAAERSQWRSVAREALIAYEHYSPGCSVPPRGKRPAQN